MALLPPELGARILAKLRILPAWGGLFVGMRRRRPLEVWIGDSHALSFNTEVGHAMFLRGPEGQIIQRVGARLMYSLATKGFPAGVHRLARFVGRFGRPGTVVPFFVAGEIDVRCHLAGRSGPFSFVSSYVDRCASLAAEMHAPRFVVVAPPPPSRTVPNIEEFPVKGSIEERVEGFRELRKALTSAVSLQQNAVLVDATDLLEAPSGELRPELTDDGCHTNLTGTALVRERVHEVVAL